MVIVFGKPFGSCMPEPLAGGLACPRRRGRWARASPRSPCEPGEPASNTLGLRARQRTRARAQRPPVLAPRSTNLTSLRASGRLRRCDVQGDNCLHVKRLRIGRYDLKGSIGGETMLVNAAATALRAWLRIRHLRPRAVWRLRKCLWIVRCFHCAFTCIRNS